eukprot:6190923-Pleurochrysis_carterae.AAC.5
MRGYKRTGARAPERGIGGERGSEIVEWCRATCMHVRAPQPPCCGDAVRACAVGVIASTFPHTTCTHR